MKGKSSKYKGVAITNSGKYSAKITYEGKRKKKQQQYIIIKQKNYMENMQD